MASLFLRQSKKLRHRFNSIYAKLRKWPSKARRIVWRRLSLGLAGAGTINADNYNIVGHTGSARSDDFIPAAWPVGSDLIPNGAKTTVMRALAANGGPTKTQALNAGGPAIDWDTSNACPPLDQRGELRLLGRVCDPGAYEHLATVNQAIPVISGWNLISSYVVPDGRAIAAVLTPVQNDMVLLKNAAGQVYWPAMGITTDLTYLEPGRGYQIFMNNPAVLTYPGN